MKVGCVLPSTVRTPGISSFANRQTSMPSGTVAVMQVTITASGRSRRRVSRTWSRVWNLVIAS
jgi:hypothetical protein